MPPNASQTSTSPSASGSKLSAELICSGCGTTLRTAAEASVEAPCPRCGQLLRYDAPTRAKLAPFQPRSHRTHRSRTKHHHDPTHRRSPGKSFLLAIRETNEFLNTGTGRLAASAVLAVLTVICVLLFFRWDQKRRGIPRSQPAEITESRPGPTAPSRPVRPPALDPPGPTPDPFGLPDHRVIEITAPTR